MAIFMTGDTHGDFSRFSARAFPEQKDLSKADYVIICGDFGGRSSECLIGWKTGPSQRCSWMGTMRTSLYFVLTPSASGTVDGCG